jgi:hypothetical protein
MTVEQRQYLFLTYLYSGLYSMLPQMNDYPKLKYALLACLSGLALIGGD